MVARKIHDSHVLDVDSVLLAERRVLSCEDIDHCIVIEWVDGAGINIKGDALQTEAKLHHEASHAGQTDGLLELRV